MLGTTGALFKFKAPRLVESSVPVLDRITEPAPPTRWRLYTGPTSFPALGRGRPAEREFFHTSLSMPVPGNGEHLIVGGVQCTSDVHYRIAA